MGCFSSFERKTRLEPAFAGISRELFLHPQPLRGERGVARANHAFRSKSPLYRKGVWGIGNISQKAEKKKVEIFSRPFLAFGAENETRTRDPNLGKVVLYQLSYFRIVDFRSGNATCFPDCECKDRANILFLQTFFKKNFNNFVKKFLQLFQVVDNPIVIA